MNDDERAIHDGGAANQEFLAEKNRQLAEANARISRLIRTVAHELRNPLAGIATEAYLFRTSRTRKDRLEAAQALEEAANRLLRLTNELLDYSRIEAGVELSTCETFNPIRLVEAVVRSFRPQAAGKALELAVDAQNAPPEVEGYPMRVEQVVVNLVGNALKFTDHGGVRVRIEARPPVWGIIVQDDGIGIPRREQAMIFEEFASVDSIDHQARRGAGLGLAICRRLCHAMGGGIRVESRKGRGSTFTVTLPLHPPNGANLEEQP